MATKQQQEQQKRSNWMRVWSNTAWWIVAVYSVPFALYTLPFIYGDFEIYKWFTVSANFGLMNAKEAGMHIRNNLRTWQIHAAAALLFVAIGPFQFNTSFRIKHPLLHKRMGYLFAVCTVVTAVSGGTTMAKVSELGPIARGLAPFMSVGTLLALAVSIVDARNKRFQSHRRWILRSAALGYSVMYTRALPPLISACLRVSPYDALDYSFPLSIALNNGLAEIYIRMYLTQPDMKKAEKKTYTDTITMKIL